MIAIDNKCVDAGLQNKLAASRRQLDAARCNEQVCRTVALNRLGVTHDILLASVDAGGLSPVQAQDVLTSIEYSMALLESSGRDKPVVIW